MPSEYTEGRYLYKTLKLYRLGGADGTDANHSGAPLWRPVEKFLPAFIVKKKTALSFILPAETVT